MVDKNIANPTDFWMELPNHTALVRFKLLEISIYTELEPGFCQSQLQEHEEGASRKNVICVDGTSLCILYHWLIIVCRKPKKQFKVQKFMSGAFCQLYMPNICIAGDIIKKNTKLYLYPHCYYDWIWASCSYLNSTK